ncbi:MAG: carbohydrate ABC transporter permease [Chloroflexota bacterium]|nr:carbohydrate ABC transporter permease [Chloroflexota bacterium]
MTVDIQARQGARMAAHRRRVVWGRLAPRALIVVFLTVLTVAFALPFYWLVSTAVKTPPQIFAFPPVWIPTTPQWINFSNAMGFFPFGQYLFNTMVICAGTVIGTLFSNSLIAYGLSCIQWPGRNLVFILLLGTLLLPFQVTLIPLFIMFAHIGWVDTYLPLIVPTFFGNAFFMFLLRQFFLTIPSELGDAVRIDGGSEFTVFWRIVIPLSKSALAVVALFAFINAWNDFLGPLIYLRTQSKYTLAIGLSTFLGQYGSQWSWLMAASALVFIPIVVLFFFTQRLFIQGITFTGSKE